MTISIAEGNRRLLVLADHLERNVPPELFDMDMWGHSIEGKDLAECGTAGCAMGHACSIPEFKALGLRWSPHGSDIMFDGYYGGFRVAEEFFGTGESEATELFNANVCGETPAQVASRIRAFVNEREGRAA